MPAPPHPLPPIGSDSSSRVVFPPLKKEDPVNPRHYADLGLYAAVYVIAKWKLGFALGNAIKYIQRAGAKPGESEERDLKKAVWYIQWRLHEINPENPNPAEENQ